MHLTSKFCIERSPMRSEKAQEFQMTILRSTQYRPNGVGARVASAAFAPIMHQLLSSCQLPTSINSNHSPQQTNTNDCYSALCLQQHAQLDIAVLTAAHTALPLVPAPLSESAPALPVFCVQSVWTATHLHAIRALLCLSQHLLWASV